MSTEVTAADAAALAKAHETKVKAELGSPIRSPQDQAIATFRAVNGRPAFGPRSSGRSEREGASRLSIGPFLMEELGAKRFLDPTQVRCFTASSPPGGAARPGRCCPDDAHRRRRSRLLQRPSRSGWIGNLSLVIERELFGQDRSGSSTATPRAS